MTVPTNTIAPRIGARVLLLDPADRVLLIHALDPADPGHHWWELPGGGLDDGEDLTDAARREVCEESGIMLTTLGRKLWVRESRFRYQGRNHHRIEHVFLGRTTQHGAPGRAQAHRERKGRADRAPLVAGRRLAELP